MPESVCYQAAIIQDDHVLLIKILEHRSGREYWVLPGGGREAGESEEECVRREMKEETGLELQELRQFRVYSDPTRDPRGHVVSVVFTARGVGKPAAGDDADRCRLIDSSEIPQTEIVFDHSKILREFKESPVSQAAGA